MTTIATDGPLAEYRVLCEQRLEHLVPVREPLVLISQIQRSGGTLVSQLFDGHPQCHAHPHELTIGYPKSRHWPPLDLAAPDTWFDMLYEKYTRKHFRLGYRKPAQRPGSDQIDVFPFLFLPRLQRVIFDRCVTERPMEGRRDVLDSYFTSYFNAWLDNQGLYDRPKKAVTAFAPRMHTKRASLEGLFADYPDGWLVSVVRHPAAWFASVRVQEEAYQDVGEAMRRWKLSTDATLDAAAAFPGRVIVVTYDQIVLETEATMRRLAGRIGIDMAPILLEPTFNGRPIRANSSAEVSTYGVRPERTIAYRETLEADTIARIENEAGALYEQVAAAAA